LDDEAEPFFAPHRPSVRRTTALSAAEAGTAHHKFLQHVNLTQTTDLLAESDRLLRGGFLSPEERAALDLPALAAFWNSPLGEKIRTHATDVQRELPFTVRFSPQEIAEIIGGQTDATLADEFIVVQGVADLVVLLPKEIWLVDFKTDEVRANDLKEKVELYRPQLQLYSRALEQIYSRPVTLCALHFLTARRTENLK
jgi:ATP-dependent helicase/nuclease subunit A